MIECDSSDHPVSVAVISLRRNRRLLFLNLSFFLLFLFLLFLFQHVNFKFLKGHFTINDYSYSIEILEQDSWVCNLRCSKKFKGSVN